jgi:HEAT repeat protein
MATITPIAAYKEYCSRYFGELRNPFSAATLPVDSADLEASLEIFESILAAGPSPKQLKGLETQFYSAFNSYLGLPRTQIGNLGNALDKLANLVDPFMKQVAFHFLPQKEVTQKNSHRVLLWKTPNYTQVLEVLGVIEVATIYKDQSSFWEKQSATAAILRKGFSARQRGAHESRIHTLQELEAEAYSIIGQYVVICLHLLHDPALSAQINKFTEKARTILLLRERVRTFSLTNTLLSRKEHLLLYRHRNAIDPDLAQKRFLFLNYIAKKGPCFFWMKSDTPAAIEWAWYFMKTSQDEEGRRIAIQYLLTHKEPVPLALVVETLSSYADKVELAQYLRQSKTSRDRVLLLSLSRDKREEVAAEAKCLLTEMFPRIDTTFKALALSRSETKRKLLRLLIKNIADPNHIDRYRTFQNINDLALRVIYIYCLGEVGDASDVSHLRQFADRKRLNRRVSIAFWYALTRIYSRLGLSEDVKHILAKKDGSIFEAAVAALTRKGLGRDLSFLLAQAKFSEQRTRIVCDALTDLVIRTDRKILREFLSSARLHNNTRGAVLALCQVGNSSDCAYILRLVGKAQYKIDLYNHVRIAEALSSICSHRLGVRLKRYLNCPEFWKYIEGGKKRPRSRLPIKETENQALIRRLLAACFLKVASRSEIWLIMKLLGHNYAWIAKKAAERIGEIGNERDLDKLNERLLRKGDLETDESTQILDGLCAIDQRLYLR